MYFHQSVWRSERYGEVKYNKDIYGCHIWMLPFPYKEAITNAYGLIMVARNKILWKLWPNRSHSNTPGQPVSSYDLQEKAKGQ